MKTCFFVLLLFCSSLCLSQKQQDTIAVKNVISVRKQLNFSPDVWIGYSLKLKNRWSVGLSYSYLSSLRYIDDRTNAFFATAAYDLVKRNSFILRGALYLGYGYRKYYQEVRKTETTTIRELCTTNGFYGRVALDALVPIGNFLEIGTSAVIGDSYSPNIRPTMYLTLNYTF